ETVPALSRVAVLWNPENAIFQGQMVSESLIVARALGIELEPFGARSLGEIDQAFVAMTGARVSAMLVMADPILTLHRTRIVDLAGKSRLPAMYGTKDYVVAGGLMAYGPNYEDVYRRAATYVDKILKGAKPADLPVEQSTKFPLVLNL